MANSSSPRRRMPFLFWVGAFLMVAGAMGWVALRLHDSRPMSQTTITLGKATYQVEVASTHKQQSKGLMFREHLDADKGMLFVFKQESPQAIWMKNTKIPLDVLFFDYHGTVVHIRENIPPCLSDPCPVYPSNRPARYILELAAGQAKTQGISVGDKLVQP